MNHNHPPGDAINLSIVIPAYNERESLDLLHEKLVTVLTPLGLSWEIIYIDDGSSDGSTEILQDIQATDSHVVLAVQRRNFGKSQALAVGFALAQGEVLITLDADLQDEPAEIPHLLAGLNEGFDVVIGWRQQRLDSLSKRLPSWFANRVTRALTGLHIHDMNSGLKAYRRDCIERISLYGDMHRYIPILAHFMGFSVIEVPVQHHKRQFGYSKYHAGRLLRGGLDLITVIFLNRYGRRPLHLFGLFGGITLLAGLVINLALAAGWLFGQRPIGNRPLLLGGVALTLMGLQILLVGLLAEMLVAFNQRSENPLNLTTTVLRAGDKPKPKRIFDVAVNKDMYPE